MSIRLSVKVKCFFSCGFLKSIMAYKFIFSRTFVHSLLKYICVCVFVCVSVVCVCECEGVCVCVCVCVMPDWVLKFMALPAVVN